MIAAISPADYEETLSTLRYADRAKRIVNQAVVNEDPNAKLVRELKEELELLRSKLAVYNPEEAYAAAQGSTGSIPGTLKAKSRHNFVSQTEQEIKEQMEVSEKLMQELNETWEDKLKNTEKIQQEREKALEELGITIEKNEVGVHSPKKTPHLVNLNEDPLMSECLIYSLKLGKTKVGLADTINDIDIKLSGGSILPEHCYFENVNNTVTLHPCPNSITMVNGALLTQPKRLRTGFRIILGDNHVFRFMNPEEVRRERDRSRLSISVSMEQNNSDQSFERPDSRASMISDVVDWSFAWKEVNLTNFPNLDSVLKDPDLKKIMEDESCPPHIKRMLAETLLKNGESSFIDLEGSPKQDTLSLHSKSKSEDDSKEELKRVIREQRRQFEEHVKAIQHSRRGSELFVPQIFTEHEKKLINLTLSKLKQKTFVGMMETLLTNAVVLKEANVISCELKKGATYQFTIIPTLSLALASSFWEYSSPFDELDAAEDTALIGAKYPAVAVQVLDHHNGVWYLWSIDKLKDKLRRMRNLYNLMDRPMYAEHFSLEDPFYESPAPHYNLVGVSEVTMSGIHYFVSQTFTVPILCPKTSQTFGKIKVTLNPIQCVNPTTKVTKMAGTSSSFELGDQLTFEVVIHEISGLKEVDFTEVHAQFRLFPLGSAASAGMRDRVYATEPSSDFGTGNIVYNFRHTFALKINQVFLDGITEHPLSFEVWGKPQPKILLKRDHEDRGIQNEDIDVNGVDPSSNSKFIGGPVAGAVPKERRPEDELIQKETHDFMTWVQISELAPSGDYVPAEVEPTGAVDQGVFQLRQGLQRRIVVKMSHNSGKQFIVDKVTQITLGNIRSADKKGRFSHNPNTKSGAPNSVQLNILPSTVYIGYSSDGTCNIMFQATWDSSLHDSELLNRPTASNQRIMLALSWNIECDRVQNPLTFQTDISIVITSRTTSVSKSLLALIPTSSKPSTKVSSLYQVILTPKKTKKRTELWRLDTSTTYVRGEENLGSWKPKDVSLIVQHRKLERAIQMKKSVEFTKQTLLTWKALDKYPFLFDDKPTPKSGKSVEQLLKDSLEIWNLSTSKKDETIAGGAQDSTISNAPSEADPLTPNTVNGNDPNKSISSDAASLNRSDPLKSGIDNSILEENSELSFLSETSQLTPPNSEDGVRSLNSDSLINTEKQVKMLGQVNSIIKPDKVAKRGYLLMPDPIDNTWNKKWIVIRR
jgi:kinesin family protein 1